MLTFVAENEGAGFDDNSTCFPNTEVNAVTTQDSPAPMQPPLSPSSQASLRTVEGEPICRICLDRGTEPLVSPCKCAGSAKFAHESCLLQWFFKTRRRRCELCLSEVNVKSVGFKPLQKWRLPTDSCDFVFYLFTLYCVIMFVFTGMIIWIATQGCLSPVCITLYVICSMSLVYFIYCCGCVEYSKTYWKACVTTNKNWRIYNREESARTRIKATRVVSTGSESAISKKSDMCADHCAVTIPTALEGTSRISEGEIISDGERSVSSMHNKESILSGSTTLVHSYHQADDTRRIEVMSPEITNSFCSSPSSLSPVAFGRELAHAGSISLLMELNYYSQQSTCTSHTNKKELKKDMKSDNEEDDDENDENKDELKHERPGSSEVTSLDQENETKVVERKGNGDGVSNKGFDDTKL